MYRDGASLSYAPEHDAAQAGVPASEESLVDDDRAGLSPAQQVERKLVSLLRNTPLSVSQLQSVGRMRSLS
jgi:hypothetical protein